MVVWLRVRPGDRRVAGSILDSADFLTNSYGHSSVISTFFLGGQFFFSFFNATGANGKIGKTALYM